MQQETVFTQEITRRYILTLSSLSLSSGVELQPVLLSVSSPVHPAVGEGWGEAALSPLSRAVPGARGPLVLPQVSTGVSHEPVPKDLLLLLWQICTHLRFFSPPLFLFHTASPVSVLPFLTIVFLLFLELLNASDQSDFSNLICSYISKGIKQCNKRV